MSILLSVEDWNSCRVELARLRWGPPSWEGRKYECTTNDLTAWRLEAGSVSVKTSRISFVVRAGEWLFLGAGYRKQEFTKDARLVSLAFRAYWPESYLPVLDLRPGWKTDEALELDGAVEDIRQRRGNPEEYEWHYRGIPRDLESVLEMDGWFRDWMARAVRLWKRNLPDVEASRDVDPRVEEARRWLMDQALDAPLFEVDGAARAAGLSPGHLNRLFLHHYHQTLHGFHEQRRIRHARRALLVPGARIKNVASELGFRDLSKFSSWFRRLEQLSPRSYKNRLSMG